MKRGLFFSLSLSNIKKNMRFYLPHIMAGAGLFACFYIVLTLTTDEKWKAFGGGALSQLMLVGLVIIAMVAFMLTLYKNGFLMKQRKREFGLYIVLGLEKRHVRKTLFWETIISDFFSLTLGVLLGIPLYKVCVLGICAILSLESDFGLFYISVDCILKSALFFVCVDIFVLMINSISVSKIKPIALLNSSKVGEREPKIKWPLFILGILFLGLGYYFALTTENPSQSAMNFLIAVPLVIIGTYFLFVAGSIAILKSLKKNNGIYYNKKRMPSISGLLYRMKQNAVGLASITILSTCVIIMIGTSLCMRIANTYNELICLGIILGTVFLFATTLIIYYKQISEGYEDRNRFQIMRKIGMTEKEIKSTIRSQILIVFFSPLMVALVHISVAYPLLVKLLQAMSVKTEQTFFLCMAGTFLVYALVYFIIYSITSKIYYKIISERR